MGKTDSMAEANIAEEALSNDGSDMSRGGGGTSDFANALACA